MLPTALVLALFWTRVHAERCLDSQQSDNCFTSFDDIAQDLGNYGKSISELAALPIDAGNNSLEINVVGEPTKPLTLQVLEAGVRSNSSIAMTPIGYLTRYGYVRGVLTATCGSDNEINGAVIVDSMITFTHAAQLDRASAFHEMDKARCSEADITFGEDGQLDESSEALILSALGGDTNLALRRKKRYAIHRNGRGNLGVDKTEYSYKLHTDPAPVTWTAAGQVDTAFAKWSAAIGSSVTFSRHEGAGEADINLRFVADEHDDFTFSGNEIAHAPFPLTDNHGNVHFRENRPWADGAEGQLNFLYVALHELGHLLGLKHSDVANAIMQPIIDSATTPPPGSNVDLSDDEKLGIKVLYGEVSSRCEAGWTGYDGRCFVVQTVSAGSTWDEALLSCQELHGSLVSVTDGVCNSFIAANVANGRTPYWVGRKSTDDGWVNGEQFGTYIPENSGSLLSTSREKCLRTAIFAGLPIWEYISCTGRASSRDTTTEHYVCEREEQDEVLPTTQPASSPPPVTPDREQVPCQNYVRAALRRANYMYVFGSTMFFKYYYTNKRPLLQAGYPKFIENHFPNFTDFSAVVNDPYNKKRVYFLVHDTVYAWVLGGKRDTLELGQLEAKKNRKARKMMKVFKTGNTMDGAVKFDSNSIFLFGNNGEVGKWYRRKEEGKSVGKYEVVDKWDYFGAEDDGIKAVTDSYFNNYAIFFKLDSYFFLRKSDGRIPKKFKRAIDSDFDKLSICDVVAPLSDPYPESLDPDQALEDEESVD